MSAVVGRPSEADRFAADRDATVAAFRARFVSSDGSLKESGQTGYALAFTMAGGLIPPELRLAAAQHFAAAIAAKNHHLATGFIGTPRLLPGLHAAGRSDLSARLLLNETYPSWLYQVKLGATTMWERWDGWTPDRGFSDVGMNSFNHYAFGSVGDYLYRHIAGIAPLAPGYQRIAIAPTLTPGLTHAAATYDSPAGLIKSAWRIEQRDGDVQRAARYHFEITIPPNVTAEIRLPLPEPGLAERNVQESGRPIRTGRGVNVVVVTPTEIVLEVGPGAYRFTMER